MAVNEDYYGASSDWLSASTLDNSDPLTVKIPKTNTADTNYNRAGSFQYLWGADYADTGELNITLDKSFAYIGMDKDAPQNKWDVSSGYLSSTATDDQRYGVVTVRPQHTTSMGWCLLDEDVTRQPQFQRENGAAFTDAPINYDATWMNPAWEVQHGTNYSQPYVGWNGWHLSPVLSLPYFKRLKLVPVVNCCSLKTGKTVADYAACTSTTEVGQTINTYRQFDLATYLNGQVLVGGTAVDVKDAFPIITSVWAVPVQLIFSGTTLDRYASVNNGSVGAGKSYWQVFPMFNETFTFDHLYRAYNNSYDATDNAGLEVDLSLMRTYSGVSATIIDESTVTGGVQSQTTFPCGQAGGWLVSGMPGNTYFTSAARTNMRATVVDPDSWIVHFNVSGGSAYSGTYFQTCYNTVAGFGGVEAFREYVRKVIAYYGMFFSDGVLNAVPENSDMTTAGLFLGTVDNNGITHGAYTEGIDNPLNPNYRWDDPMADNEFDPDNPDPEEPDEPEIYDQFSPGVMSNGYNVGLKYFLIPYDGIDSILNYLAIYSSYTVMTKCWASAETFNPGAETAYKNMFPDAASWTAYVMSMCGYGASPYDDIVGVMAYPFDCSTKISHGSTAVCPYIGYKATNQWYDFAEYYDYESGDPEPAKNHGLPTFNFYDITQNGFVTLDLCTDYKIKRLWNDFRDFEPYTRFELNVPYFGTFELTPSMWIGATLSVRCYVEIITGSALCVVMRNGSPVFTAGAQLGVSVPLVVASYSGTCNTWSEMSASYQNAKGASKVATYTALTDAVGSLINYGAGNLSAGLSTGGSAGAIAGAVSGVASRWKDLTAGNLARLQGLVQNKRNLKAMEYTMNHPTTGTSLVSAGSPSSNMRNEVNCMLVRHRCKTLPQHNESAYAHSTGYACNRSATVSNFSKGYTQFTNVVLDSIPATEFEKEQILSAFQSGVILNY